MAVWVKVTNEQALTAVEQGLAQVPAMGATVLAEAAIFHSRAVEASLPEPVKGKLTVNFAPVAEGSVYVGYSTITGSEGSTLTNKTTFIPSDKMTSTRTPTVSRGGEPGVFLSKVSKTGRPSIESYLAQRVLEVLPTADAATVEMMRSQLSEELALWFQSHNINFNPAVGLYQAGAGGGTLPSGAVIPGGRFVVGAL